jgi:restriction endonuclease Mrr
MTKRSSDAGGILLLIIAAFGFLWSLFKYPIPTLVVVNILTIIFFPQYFWTVFFISFVIGLIYYGSKQKSPTSLTPSLPVKNLSPESQITRQQIITGYQTKLHRDSFPYYIENQTRDCIRDIMIAEGMSSKAPKIGEYLSNWRYRQDVPQNYKDLAKTVENLFKKQLTDLEAEADRKQEEQRLADEKESMMQAKNLCNENKVLIEKFFDIAERKVSILDDYGDERWDALPLEINSVLRKILQKDGIKENVINDYFKKGYGWNINEKYLGLRKFLDQEFRKRHSTRKPVTSDYNSLSGVEFETQLAHILQDKNYVVSGTPSTGDQGADLIAKKDGKTIIIQAKRYKGSVGNKAVQEVIGAVQFYGGDEGWVVTNSTFTPSAKALAQKGGIKLIDGKSLEKIK